VNLVQTTSLDVEIRVIIVYFVIAAYRYVLFLRIILSWFPIQPPPALRPAFNFLYDLTEPFLRIFRKLLPPVVVGGMGLDLSPLLGFVVLVIVQQIAARALLP
jgi:YggT family protein